MGQGQLLNKVSKICFFSEYYLLKFKAEEHLSFLRQGTTLL